MIEVHERIHVGTRNDYENIVKGKEKWCVVHACKDPYHRSALGYTGRSAPKDHAEYLVARRPNRLILNLVDANDPKYFAKEIFVAALDFIDESLSEGKDVLIHCNQGESRGPSIALLYLAARARVIPADSLESAEEAFRMLYPEYSPNSGVRGHLAQNWTEYTSPQ